MTSDTKKTEHTVTARALPTVQLALLACLLAILASAMGVVMLAQKGRLLFAELETMRKQQEQLETRWSRLTLQRSTLLSPANVERVARKKLVMIKPPTHEIVVVQP